MHVIHRFYFLDSFWENEGNSFFWPLGEGFIGAPPGVSGARSSLKIWDMIFQYLKTFFHGRSKHDFFCQNQGVDPSNDNGQKVHNPGILAIFIQKFICSSKGLELNKKISQMGTFWDICLVAEVCSLNLGQLRLILASSHDFVPRSLLKYDINTLAEVSKHICNLGMTTSIFT